MNKQLTAYSDTCEGCKFPAMQLTQIKTAAQQNACILGNDPLFHTLARYVGLLFHGNSLNVDFAKLCFLIHFHRCIYHPHYV